MHPSIFKAMLERKAAEEAAKAAVVKKQEVVETTVPEVKQEVVEEVKQEVVEAKVETASPIKNLAKKKK